jgi:hypothetical protein
MICKKCGNQMNNNEKFCIRCGEPVSPNNTVNKKSKKKIIIPIAAVCAVLLIIIIVAVSNSTNNNSNTYIDNEYQYNGDDYIENEDEIQNTTQETLLVDSCQYVLATGYDEDGTCYQLVGEDYEDYQESRIRIGVIKNNAWLIEMTTETPFIDEYNCIYGSQSLHNDYVLEGYGTLKNATNSESNFYDRFGYIGKGSFYLLGVKRNTGGYFIEDELQTIVFWNTETNKSKIINNITMDDMDNYIQGNDVIISELTEYNFRLSNDAFAELDVKSLNPETFETKKLFSKTLTVNNGMSNNVYQIADELIYSNGSFYNLDGKKAFDLNIKNVQDIGHFNNGKCEIITQIDTGTKYRVIIDKTGKVISNEKISG